MLAEMAVQSARARRVTSASSSPPCLQKRRARAERRRSGRATEMLLNAHLGAYEFQDLVPPRRERRVGHDLLPDAAISGNVDRDGGLEATGTPREDEATVSEKRGLVHVVGDQEDGLPGGDRDAIELFLERDPRLRVHCGERLVHQHDDRVRAERARECDALFHAARQLVGVALLEAREPDQLDEFSNPPTALLPGHALELEAVPDVARHRAPGQDRMLLE